MDDGRIDAGIGLEIEGAQRLFPGEAGGFDPALGAAAGAVVAFGHQQLGEKGAIGHLLAGGGLGQLGKLGADADRSERG
jgi:hypothetical protein